MADGKDIIDLQEWVRRKEEEASTSARTVFSLYGGEGERSRFALPLWRAAYLAGGFRAGVAWAKKGESAREGPVEAFVVLDLKSEPARLDYAPACLGSFEPTTAAGSLLDAEGAASVYLGETDERWWFMVVDDLEAAAGGMKAQEQRDLLFLAGECAGLLFHRGLAAGKGE